jgi:hypothetical protein
MLKGLYMWHTPKTGGLAISVIGIVLRARQTPSVFPNYNPNLGFDPSFDYSYIQGHYGTLPVDKNPELDTAILIRDPLDRSVSNFIWLYMENVLTEMEPYKSMDSMLERLRYYLFEDQTFLMHRNMQTRFLSNGIAEETVNFLHGYDQTTPITDDTSRPNIYIHWFIPDNNTSVELAKSQVDRATILGITEDHEPFTEKVLAWFRDNYDLDLSEIYYEELNRLKRIKSLNAGRNLDPYLNFSSYTDSDDTTYTTQSLKALLTQDDIDRIYANNSLDLELYNYAKAKLQ